MDSVSRRFGDFDAVSTVSLEVPASTILGLIGPSGSGKTTVVRMCTGTLAPTAGTLRVLSEEPRRFHRKTRERIGYMPQHFVLYPELTTAENVAFVASLFGMLWWRRRKRAKQVLQFVELWDVRNRRAGQLSGGMQRRLELACALVHEPAILFLDEPTAGIDPVLRQTIWEELRRLRDAGRTLFVTTQYVGEAEHCDQVALLQRGRLVALAPPEELRRKALSGDVIELETNQELTRGAVTNALKRIPGFKRVQPTEHQNKWLVIVEDAGEATPRLMEEVARHDWEVVTLREYRPSFDEVFARLLTDGDNGQGGHGRG